MKTIPALITAGLCLPLLQAETEIEGLDLGPELKPTAKHAQGSEKVAVDQDELSADVQQLVLEQTNQKVIDLLGEVENIMDEATEMLIEHDTGGKTIAAQTEVIEKIYEAAKEKNKSCSSCNKSGGAMMDMMKKMMGEGQGQKPGNKPGQKPGQAKGEGQGNGGKGQTGDSSTANTDQNGIGTEDFEKRRIPKASGNGSISMPEEFRTAFDAYNRGAETLVK